MSLDPISAAIDFGSKIIDKIFPDANAAARAKLELLSLAQTGELQEFAGSVAVVQEEAKSEGWLTRSWRPITMLTFTALVVAYWLGFTAPNITQATVELLLDIVKVGLGGYVVGRSAEKIATTIAPMLRK